MKKVKSPLLLEIERFSISRVRSSVSSQCRRRVMEGVAYSSERLIQNQIWWGTRAAFIEGIVGGK